jgi:hypothetical protein
VIRHLREVSCRGTAAATVAGRMLAVGIVVLIVTVGTLAAGSRLPTIGRYANTRHTVTTVRLAKTDREEADALAAEDFCAYPRDAISERPAYRRASPPPPLTGAFPPNCLRAPPQS